MRQLTRFWLTLMIDIPFAVTGALIGSFVALTSVGTGTSRGLILLNLYPLRMVQHRLVAKDIVHSIPLAMVAWTGCFVLDKVDLTMLVSLLAS